MIHDHVNNFAINPSEKICIKINSPIHVQKFVNQSEKKIMMIFLITSVDD